MQSYRQILENKFDTVYNQLNEQQKKAVDHIEGPVMVIAGPGTGKTQILGARIGKILLDTDTAPENILCLTYTDAGVVAMRKRLISFIGAAAYRVNIYTFHAFCNDVIQENLSVFEKNSLDPISDLEKIVLFKKLIDAFPKENPLKRYRGDVYYEIKNLQSLFSTMKKEGWTSDHICERIQQYIDDLPQRDEFVTKRATKDFKKGDVRTDKIREVIDKMEKLKAAVCEFNNFQKLMRDSNRYDFDDMINWVIKAFEEDENLLRNYQERFQYILIDEYQDTSGTQNRLVELLISYWDKPNVFVVGDDDQSIFRFQGANVENMISFANEYSNDLITIVLSDNYRSTQPILNVSKNLIDRNNERLVSQLEGLTKELRASHINRMHLLHQPVIREYETQRQEMIDIVLQVEKLVGQNIEPGRIAILFKENKYGEEISNYLKLKNIPFYTKRNMNLFDIPLSKKIIQMFRYLDCEHDISYSGDEILFEMLHFDWFNIPPIEIAKLSLEAAETQFTANKKSIRKILSDKSSQPNIDLFTPSIDASLAKASLIIEKLISNVPNVTTQVLFENIIREAGVLSVIMKSEEKHWLLQVLSALFDFIKEETARNPSMNVAQLVSMFDVMEKEGLSIPLVQVSGNDKGVNLLTTHGSKGLEFLHVFFAGCNAGYWEKKRKFSNGFTFPDTMFSSQNLSSDNEELRRLFYVAITRAEEHLHISYSKFRNDGKTLEPSMFIEEIKEDHDIPVEKVMIMPEVLAEFLSIQFGDPLSPEIERAEKELMDRLLEKFTMNVTALNNYLKCPLQFYFQNLIRIPSPKNEATEFGSAVHFALEKLFSHLKDNNNQFPSKEFFMEKFEWYLKRHRESFTKEQFARRMEYGQTVLPQYYDTYIDSWNRIVSIERNIRGVVVNGVPVKGKLDKLEFNGKQVNVVDYKTGNPENAKSKLLAPNDKDPNGGDYWRQAVFYKLLVEESQKDWSVVSCEFDFIEPDNKKIYQRKRIVIAPADVETVKQQIKTVWEKIQDHDFYTGCGKDDCHWCNFVKTNNMAIALHESVIEDEEN